MLQIKNTETKMKNAFDRPISRLTDDMAKERISEFEDLSIETSKIEKQRKRDWKKWNRISINFGTTIKDATYA